MSLRIQGVLHEDAKIFFIDEMTNKTLRIVDLSSGPFDEQGLSAIGTKCHIVARRALDGKAVAKMDITGIFQTDPILSITNDADDGQFSPYSFLNINSTVGIGSDGMGPLSSFFRFANATLLPTNSIVTAFLRMSNMNNWSGTPISTVVRVRGIAMDHCPELSSREQIESLALTTAYSDYTISLPTFPQNYDIPGIASIINEIISRPGWTIGNALGILISVVSGGGAGLTLPNLSTQLHLTY